MKGETFTKRDLLTTNGVCIGAFLMLMLVCPLLITDFKGEAIHLPILLHALAAAVSAAMIILLVINLICAVLDYQLQHKE